MEYIVVLLIILLAFQTYFGYRERKELTEKLMAKSLRDYKDNTEPPEPNQLDEEDETIPIEEAEEFLNAETK
ncbi:MAG: hypothetical protein D6822_00140 [Cyanobacteria bacterium J149]|nr:MAG: hypothetical protein D6822_00140 [Cyanobacteria bacterium J149]